LAENDAGGGFSASGRLRGQDGDLPSSLTLLLSRLGDFLARLDSCERAESGEYHLASRYGGSVGGAKAIWDEVTMQAHETMRQYLRVQQSEGDVVDPLEYGPNGVAGFGGTQLVAPEGFLPLHEVLWQLFWSLPSRGEAEGSTWPLVLPKDTGPRFRALERELERRLAGLPKPASEEPALPAAGAAPILALTTPMESTREVDSRPAGRHEQVVTTDQAAAIAGCSKKTIHRWVKSGKLAGPCYPGGQGRAHRWKWSVLHGPLQKACRRGIPEQYPGNQWLG